ncbi:PP2C family protein-serine/threonine phosphatase [Streptomyces sp. NPDC048584]|uniref:PP2C family protein-serine/threonine phosphatase n=1 Tax=Streptomyces sp. NPDC048584 TaxID=3365573 RepID=UPI0037228CE8
MIRFKPGAPHRVPPRFQPTRLPTYAVPTALGATAVAYRATCPLAHDDALTARLISSAVMCALITGLVMHVRHRLLRDLREARRTAEAAQSALLRPPPPKVDGLAAAAVHLSADPGARIGGDLYEVVSTEHGVRAVIGDVRGHGLGAVRTAAAVLGSFREAAHDEADLAGVLRRLDRAMARHLRAHAQDGPPGEEFVTVLLLEILPDGVVRALNCGHPWPYLLTGARAEPLARTEPLPPLGLFPLPADLPAVLCRPLLPGDALVLHTDGAEEARDAEGRFFPLRDVLTAAARERPLTPRSVLCTVLTALLRHTAGPPDDDVALLILRNERHVGVTAAHPHAKPHLQSPA